jgi:hypothetical protein
MHGVGRPGVELAAAMSDIHRSVTPTTSPTVGKVMVAPFEYLFPAYGILIV